jgi:hypothetical protein
MNKSLEILQEIKLLKDIFDKNNILIHKDENEAILERIKFLKIIYLENYTNIVF